MNASLIELADCRRQDLLADAARERLAREAKPDRRLAAPSPESLLHAARTARASGAGVLAALAITPLKWKSRKRHQAMMPAAR